MKLVFIDDVKRGMVTGQDVTFANDEGAPLVAKHTALTDMMIAELHRLGIKFVYIDEMLTKKRNEQLRAAQNRNFYIPTPPPVVSPKLRTVAVSSLKNIFETVLLNPEDTGSAAKIIKELDSVVDDLVESITNDKNTLVNIYDLKSYDDYTFHHSLSVAVLSIAIGRHLGFGQAELKKLGTSAIMHDIGKTAVPIEIVNKPSKLSNEEFDIIKTHSPEGYDYLIKTSLGDDNIHQAVLSHHEKIDGTGYPNKLKGDDIPIWGRIISVADVYDALTSNRPYRLPMQPADAVEYIMGSVGKSFDYDIVQAFIKTVELYPVGKQVELSDGGIGIVLNNNNIFRPVVKLIDTGDVVDLFSDLGKRSVTIAKLL